MYDNDLSPTDQLRVDGMIGPISLTGLVGTQNNTGLGLFNNGNTSDPYGSQGANYFLNVAGTGSAATDAINRRVIGFSLFGGAPGEAHHDWRSATSLPGEAWLIGLGNLGQAYLWALSLLPSSK